jgi:hypothetical protein
MESLRAGAGRLSKDLAAVETGMGDLYDAASGHRAAATPGQAGPGSAAAGESVAPPAAPAAPERRPEAAAARKPSSPSQAPPHPARPAPESAAQQAPAARGDLDGARLIALNMALNGSPRAETERYLAENFQLADREKLVDEVYAAIEG